MIREPRSLSNEMDTERDPIIPNLGLLVLDVQDSFLKVMPDRDTFVKRIQFCLETANLFDLPILLTEQCPDVLGTSIEEVRILCQKAKVVVTTGFSAFCEPEVSDWQASHEIDHLLVTGLETPVCIYQSVLDASGFALDVTVLSDAVTCRRKQDEGIVFHTFRNQGIHVLPSETVFYSILRDSIHPNFKEFTQLVEKYSD